MELIEVPLMLQITSPVKSFYLVGGPEYSFLLAHSYGFIEDYTEPATQQKIKTSAVNRSVFGLKFGINYEYDHQVVECKIGWHFSNTKGSDIPTLPNYPENIWVQFTVGYSFY